MLGSIRFYRRPSSKTLLYPPSAPKLEWLEVTLQKGPRTAPCGKGTRCVTLGAKATSKITTRKLINVVVKSFF